MDLGIEIMAINDKAMLSRIFYSNPVCILATPRILPIFEHPNVMTISWLTPVDNQGKLFMSINKKRNTATRLLSNPNSYFVLNVPVQGAEQLLVDIGSCSGSEVNKIERFNITTCIPGWGTMNADDAFTRKGAQLSRLEGRHAAQSDIVQNLIALEYCVCHVICKISSIMNSDGSDHLHLFVQCEFAFVKSSYWNGKQFFSLNSNMPPLLSFLGSKKFGYICAHTTNDSSDIDEKDNCS
jgi:flavin reductase (DIM6/NTAB) family NADH-FMN oxidoreductase RutF